MLSYLFTIIVSLLCTLWIVPLYASLMIVLGLLDELGMFLFKNNYPGMPVSFSGIKMLAKPFCAISLILLGLSCFIWSFLLINILRKFGKLTIPVTVTNQKDNKC